MRDQKGLLRMKKFTISFLETLIIGYLVMAGLPMFKAIATTTSDCLYSGGIYEVVQVNPSPWYPCGFKFKVNHYGYGSASSPCHCEHVTVECVQIVFVHPTTYAVQYRAEMYVAHINNDCGSANFPDVTYCCLVHVPRGIFNGDHWQWAYYFVCEGSRYPTSGYNYFNFDSSTCEEAEWESRNCEDDLCD
jgi:hypothetical protein